MAFTLQDFFSGLAGKDLEATQLKRAQLEAAQTALADAKAAKEGEQATASKIASMFAPQGNAEEQGGLIGLGGTPDMLPSIGQTFGQMPAGQSATQGGGGQPQKSAFQTLQEQVAQNNAVIQNLSKSSNIYDQRAAEKFKAENAKILEKMPEMQAKELDTRLKSAQAMYDGIAGIVDDQSLNLRMAQASPEERAALAKNYGIMPNFGTGMYSFNTPEVQTLIKGAKQQSLTQVQRYEQEKRLADIRNDEQQRILQERDIVEKERANRAKEAADREKRLADAAKDGGKMSLAEVIDPNDPTRMLRINAHEYKGGTLGSAGVIGVSGKEPTAAAKTAKTEGGREQLEAAIEGLRTNYKLLRDSGGMVTNTGSTRANLGASVRSSSLGQTVGGAVGTKEQTARKEIDSSRMRLLTAIMAATGQSAKQLDSNTELKIWLDSLGSTKGDYESNMAILQNIENAFLKKKGAAGGDDVDTKNPLLGGP
jgi:hypothetical protein